MLMPRGLSNAAVEINDPKQKYENLLEFGQDELLEDHLYSNESSFPTPDATHALTSVSSKPQQAESSKASWDGGSKSSAFTSKDPSPDLTLPLNGENTRDSSYENAGAEPIGAVKFSLLSAKSGDRPTLPSRGRKGIQCVACHRIPIGISREREKGESSKVIKANE